MKNSLFAVKVHHLVYFSSLALLLMGCTSVKKMSLVHELPQETALPSYPEFIIEVGDELSIFVTALDPQAAAPFNVETSHQVQLDGTIDLPILGRVVVEGKTLKEVKGIVLSLVSENLQNAFVNIYFTSASISVLGEVGNPHKMDISKPITILSAIGAAGGLTRNARYDQVEVIRTKGNKMNKYIVDLTSPELVQSPCYYLTKGDIVNVLPKYSVLVK